MTFTKRLNKYIARIDLTTLVVIRESALVGVDKSTLKDTHVLLIRETLGSLQETFDSISYVAIRDSKLINPARSTGLFYAKLRHSLLELLQKSKSLHTIIVYEHDAYLVYELSKLLESSLIMFSTETLDTDVFKITLSNSLN